MQKKSTLPFIAFLLLCATMTSKPPKNNYPKNDILYSKYGGDVEKMMREERRLDSMARPFMYQVAPTGENTESDSSTIDNESVILDKADVMPQFPDGAKGLEDFLTSSKIFTPDTLVGKKATVLVKFYINTYGVPRNPQIVKTDNNQFDALSLAIIESMPKWEPAQKNGKPVNCYQTITIKFGE